MLKSGLEVVLEIGLRNTQPNNHKKIIFTETIKEAKYKKTV
jgi:hypothetical protein